ncbi:lytic transglycosylase domain-containing protein [Viscerimonas tarda]
MKNKLIYILPIVAICGLGAVFLSNKIIGKSVLERKNPYVSSMVHSIEAPDEVMFAGETTNLERFDLHERYDREINSFAYYHSTTLLLIKRANRIFPIIEPILKENGIPDDFKYLAVIESSLNPRAFSSAKAAGLWQFMPATAKIYGLEVGNEVDERYSIEKSTKAACKYLQAAYTRYRSWKSAAISYNAGTGKVSDEREKQQVDDSLDLWLVEESSRYYFRMVAAKYLFESPARYGFILRQHQLYKPIDFKEVEVSESIADLSEFAKDKGITYAQLKEFNSWLRDRKLTITAKNPKTYTILVPSKESLYYRKGEKIKVHDKNWIVED